ncbi:MAG: aminodeoxychorismate/anthranilate synthase component II [Planctomycetota bacterium]|nr:aminodeoxychorismate/anthranilate synthase component II [Planctomycetota bacterium]
MILVLDNYDSFTYNLVQYLLELGANVLVKRNDQIDLNEVFALSPSHLILSPGPGRPEDAGITEHLIVESLNRNIPLLGVCLGHQALGHVLGGSVIRAPKPIHGKVDSILHDHSHLFEPLANPFPATRYHSLIIDRTGLPDSLRVTAWTEDGLIMGIEHRECPAFGVQFHPESIASEGGQIILERFLEK